MFFSKKSVTAWSGPAAHKARGKRINHGNHCFMGLRQAYEKGVVIATDKQIRKAAFIPWARHGVVIRVRGRA